MAATYHTPIDFNAIADDTTFNDPLLELDTAIQYLSERIDALGWGYSALDMQLRSWSENMVNMLSGSTTITYGPGNSHIMATVTWPDGSTGHCDAAVYASAPGVLQAFTASHLSSGKLVVKAIGDAVAAVITPDWYVDSSSAPGGDGSLTAPYDTLADITLAAGDIVALRSGRTWREELEIDQDNVAVYRYGPGARPIIDCSSVVAAGGFTKTGGQTYVYQATISPDLQSQETWVRVWEDNVSLVRASSIANCDATAGSYYPSSDTTAPITLYVHASNNSNPASSGKSYDTNLRRSALRANNKVGIVIDGINTKRSLWGLGSIVTGRSAKIRYCRFEDGTKHNSYVGEGTYINFTTAHDCYYGAQSSTLFVCYEPEAIGMGFTVENCTASMTTFSEYVSGFYQHPGDTSVLKLGPVVYRNIIATKCGYGAGNSGLEDSWTVDGAVFTGGLNGFLLYGDAIISNASVTLVYDAGMHVFPAVDGITVTVSDTTFDMDGHTSVYGFIYTFRNNTTVHLDTVEFIDTVTCYGVNLTGSDSVVTATGCFFNGNVIPYFLVDVTLTSDYNRFLAAWYTFDVNGTHYASVAAYQAGTGQDAHSTIG
jgi:hypothetical protein